MRVISSEVHLNKSETIKGKTSYTQKKKPEIVLLSSTEMNTCYYKGQPIIECTSHNGNKALNAVEQDWYSWLQ